MGTYYKIVNPAKRQHLDPSHFGEGIKWGSVLRGELCIEALKCLIADSHCQDSVEVPANPWDLEGSWVGDPIILAGDDSTPPDPNGIHTSTPENPARNLYVMASEEFSDISHLAIAMLSTKGFAKEIVEMAEKHSSTFLVVADLLMQVQLPTLSFEFTEKFTSAWPKRYQVLFQKEPWHKPLPIPREN